MPCDVPSTIQSYTLTDSENSMVSIYPTKSNVQKVKIKIKIPWKELKKGSECIEYNTYIIKTFAIFSTPTLTLCFALTNNSIFIFCGW